MATTTPTTQAGPVFAMTGRTPAGLSTRELARSVRDMQTMRDQAEIAVWQSALEWAARHAEPSGGDIDLAVPVAGPGTPHVQEPAIAEFGSLLGSTTGWAHQLIGTVTELAHRLPRTWALVVGGQIPPHRARMLVDHTTTLDAAAAAYVDAQFAAVTGRAGRRAVERLAAQARLRHEPDTTDADTGDSADTDSRYVSVDSGTPTPRGTCHLDAELDLVDALDLEGAIADIARALTDWGSDDPLDVRRSMALGILSRRQDTLPTGPDADPSTGSGNDDPHSGDDDPRSGDDAPRSGDDDRRSSSSSRRPASWADLAPYLRRRTLVLYAHLSADALTTNGGVAVGELGNLRTPVTADQVQAWCGAPATHISVRPVIDLNETTTSDGHQVPDKIREIVALRDRTCVFPVVRPTGPPRRPARER
ncbi:hypothetical protein ACQBAU_04730 [Propionibacteriaceae bacterium Y2011]